MKFKNYIIENKINITEVIKLLKKDCSSYISKIKNKPNTDVLVSGRKISDNFLQLILHLK